MAFSVKSLYPDETTEAIVTTFLTIVSLKSFEYILKALLTSAGSERVSTGQFSLALATDQALNPLNYFSWYRGTPDFEVNTESPTKRTAKRRIPLQRATIAVIIAILALLAEAAFFYGTQTSTFDLQDKYLHIALNHTNENQRTKTNKNTCEPIEVPQGRATLNAVLAACNIEEGQLPSIGPGTMLETSIMQNDYSVGIKISGGNRNITSTTKFTLLIPKKDNLVVRLLEDIKKVTERELFEYYEGRGCTLNRSSSVKKLVLQNCREAVEPLRALQYIVGNIQVVQNRDNRDVGMPIGDSLEQSDGDTVVGSITRQHFTSVGILSITGVLLVLATACHLLVSDDTSEVIACILREKTELDILTPAVSMPDKDIRIIRSFCEETQEWHIGTVVPPGYEERSQ